MNKEFVPYQESLVLKDLGFDELCLGQFTSFSHSLLIGDKLTYKDINKELETLAPTFSQAFKWFREKHNLYCGADYWRVDSSIAFKIWNKGSYETMTEYQDTYEEAELECLRTLIIIIIKLKNER